jgi:glycosyltransferase involved in cell wall biosynthesis
MKRTNNNIISQWREEGGFLIKKNFQEFHGLVNQSRNFMERGLYNAAAIYAEIAATYAIGKHCGLFVSPELESILAEIGQKVIPNPSILEEHSIVCKNPKHILHVATSVTSIGGHSRMIWRWIQQDIERSHSLVLTRQTDEIPLPLREAVSKSRGEIHILNEETEAFQLVALAKRLREISATADRVILHISNCDVVPQIAFANKEKSPPICLLDHADHVFWLGTSISDLIISLRESGMSLAQERRGISKDRSILLPIILKTTDRKLSQAEAKQKLGLSTENILLLSVARSMKYKTIDGVNYADAHVPVLQDNEKAVLIIVGPGTSEDYTAAIQKTKGRIIVYPEREDTDIFYQAADIYVDSFPFVSTTSLLEAGIYGVPLVSRFPYSDASNVLGADVPGLTGNLIRTRDLEEYRKTLSHLIEDKKLRLSLGGATRRKIMDTHTGNYWQDFLEKIYTCAEVKPRDITLMNRKDEAFVGEPDVFLQRIYSTWDDNWYEWLVAPYLPSLPFYYRLKFWWKYIKKNGFGRRGHIRFLLP